MLLKFFKHALGVLLLIGTACSGQTTPNGITAIDKALAEKKYEEADSLLQPILDAYYAQRQADSLVNYIFYVGKVAQKKTGTEQAVKKLDLFIRRIKTLSPSPVTLRQIHLEAGEFYGSVGLNKQAYQSNKEAYRYTLLMPAKTGSALGRVENNLATYAQRMGDLNLSQSHGRDALKHLLSDPKVDYEPLYIAYNGMGTGMWYASKTDSSLYYFNEALKALGKTARTPLNQFYRPAIVNNNLSALYQLQGKTTEAIAALKSTIADLKMFLSSKEPNTKKVTAVTFQYEAIDNLAGFYKELGDLKKAKELLEYSYQQKQANLTPGDPAVFISEILLGQLYFATKEFDKSLRFLNSGLTKIASSDGDYLFSQADACNTLALLYDAKHDLKKAAFYYEKADSLYEASLQGEYDVIYLDFLRNAALFYAENGSAAMGIAKAQKGYDYVVNTNGAKTTLGFLQLLNLSEVCFLSGKFKEAALYSRQGLEVVNNMIRTSTNLLDSIKMELKKPKAVLLKVKAEYEGMPVKNVASLSVMSGELNEALLMLERRKSILNDAEDIGLLMADHNELLEFVKKITLDLYKLTNDNAYVEKLMSLHESGIYNRIRSRLDKNDSLQFADIPATTMLMEKKLRSSITAALDGDLSHDEKMQRYFKAIDQWNAYQEQIRVDHPRYYAMRYASIFKSLTETQRAIPPATTLIRYFFVGKDLFALVADNKKKQVYPIDKAALAEQISTLSTPGINAVKTGEILYSLHRQLWAPLAKNVHHKKVIIIPDGILFNLNFEILTPQKITRFKELATRSLLANYTISYQYSLLLLSQKHKPAALSNSFVAFAPGFSDKIKERYRSASKDSLEMDKAYLSLLPQPFTLGLATKTQQLLGGSAFINDASTESSFKAHAGNHKIIHIGTHAESNNDYPAFSRLIFAKDTSSGDEDNSLFVDEIYNCELTSNLAVLTACESGRPGYQDGEGMISLAHAFNYAGSESILTGLWKIDEQASAILLDLFYQNLLAGIPKDEALRKAKLSYLERAEGRMLAPQYWAGLVLMGDTQPIMLRQNRSGVPWIIGGIAALVLLGAYYNYTAGRKRATSGKP